MTRDYSEFMDPAFIDPDSTWIFQHETDETSSEKISECTVTPADRAHDRLLSI